MISTKATEILTKTYGDQGKQGARLIQRFIDICREDDLPTGRILIKYSRNIWSELGNYVSHFISSRPNTRELLHTLLNAISMTKLPTHISNGIAEKRRDFEEEESEVMTTKMLLGKVHELLADEELLEKRRNYSRKNSLYQKKIKIKLNVIPEMPHMKKLILMTKIRALKVAKRPYAAYVLYNTILDVAEIHITCHLKKPNKYASNFSGF